MKYNVFNIKGVLIESGLTSEEIKEKYEIDHPDRIARRGWVSNRMYRLTQVEEKKKAGGK